MCHWISLTSATLLRAQQIFSNLPTAAFYELKSMCRRRRARVLMWRGIDGAPYYCCSVEHKGEYIILGDNEFSGLSAQVNLALSGKSLV
jgi:hypothetical protein